jgi:hypothetical protein
MSEDRKKFSLRKPTLKMCIIAGIILVAAVVAWTIFNTGITSGSKKVEFQQLEKDDIPKTIETDVIPEYRELERALGCLIDGKVYVVVTRGEKPTAGYQVEIEDMTLEQTDEGTHLKVNAIFIEPEDGVAVSQVITYPYAVAETELIALPDTIELIAKYA